MEIEWGGWQLLSAGNLTYLEQPLLIYIYIFTLFLQVKFHYYVHNKTVYIKVKMKSENN